MKKRLAPKQFIAVPCPTCGAATGEPCEYFLGRYAASHSGIGDFRPPMLWGLLKKEN